MARMLNHLFGPVSVDSMRNPRRVCGIYLAHGVPLLALLTTTSCGNLTSLDHIISAGASPAVALGRTGLDTTIELRGNAGVDITVGHYAEDGWNGFSFGYLPFQGQAGTVLGNLIRFDIIQDGWFGLRGWQMGWGPSFFFMDFDGGARGEGSDTLGAGYLIRNGWQLMPTRKTYYAGWGLQVHVDLHGWFAFDRYGVQVAGAAELAASLLFAF